MLQGMFRDVTERNKKERELNQERDKIAAMTQSVGAGFVIVGKDYRVQWANHFISKRKGNSEGKFCYKQFHNRETICPDCGVKKVFEEGAPLDAHECAEIDISGNPYCIEIIATPIKDAAGNVTAAVEIVVDITEKKNLQRKIAEYSEQLEKLVEKRTKQ